MPEHLTHEQAQAVAACISLADDVHEVTAILLALIDQFPATDWLDLVTLGPRDPQTYRNFAHETYQPSKPWSLGPQDPWTEIRATLRAAELVDRRERQQRPGQVEAGEA